MYRNFFSKLTFTDARYARRVKAAREQAEEDGVDPDKAAAKVEPSAHEGVRVFIDKSVGYSGSKQRYRDQPLSGERALIANLEVRHPVTNEKVQQCSKCRDYFAGLNYFKINPEQKKKVTFIVFGYRSTILFDVCLTFARTRVVKHRFFL